MRARSALLAIALAGVALWPGGERAVAADDSAVLARIERLERELRDLERDYYRGGGRAPSSSSQSAGGGGSYAGDESSLAVRMTSVEESLRSLTGQLEQLAYRVNQMEGNRGGAPSASSQNAGPPAVLSSAPPPPSEPSPNAPPDKGVESLGTYSLGAGETPPPPAGDENAQFAAAVDVLYRGDNEGGAAALQSFVTQHPKSPKAGEAYFWLGNAYLAQKAFREAAEAFLTTVQKYPKDPKAPQALVKLGSTLIQGGQKTEGCKQLKTVKSVFPKASQEILDMAARERARAGCK